MDNLEDAALEIEESMGEELKLFLGECFITVNEEQAQTYVDRLTEEKQAFIEDK